MMKLARRGYALLFAFVFILYPAAASLPPYLMVRGHERAAGVLYKLFSPLCHQLPQRCYFLFGPQSWYPLELSGQSGLLTLSAASGLPEESVRKRAFIGTPEMGYKMAVCQRDVAIYLSLALFCVVFCLSGNRLPKLSTKLWILLSLLPMALDGFSQLFSWAIPAIPVRESTPLLRSITGGMFGFFLGWFLLPRLEESLSQENAE